MSRRRGFLLDAISCIDQSWRPYCLPTTYERYACPQILLLQSYLLLCLELGYLITQNSFTLLPKHQWVYAAMVHSSHHSNDASVCPVPHHSICVHHTFQTTQKRICLELLFHFNRPPLSYNHHEAPLPVRKNTTISSNMLGNRLVSLKLEKVIITNVY